MREGVDRFFITDISNPAATALAQSQIPVLIERIGNHEPEGGHVLFMDGHVEYIEFPGKFPMTKAFIEGLQSLENVSKAVAEEAAVAPNVIASEEPQESQIAYTFGDGIPKESPYGFPLLDVRSIAVTAAGMPVAAALTGPSQSTPMGKRNLLLMEFDGERWEIADPFIDHVDKTPQHDEVATRSGRVFYGDPGVTMVAKINLAAKGAHLKATEEAVWQRPGPDGDLKIFEAKDEIIRALAATESGLIAIGTSDGLHIRAGEGEPFEKIYPADTRYSWTPREVRALAFDSVGRLWIGCEQGVGALDGDSWTLYTEAEGLRSLHLCGSGQARRGLVWHGSRRGLP
jgi:prepilin-type processing-associated H-X9-DG protein